MMKTVFVWFLVALIPIACCFICSFALGWKDPYGVSAFFVSCCLALVVWALAFGGAYIGMQADQITCRNTASNMAVEWRWSVSTGCLFKWGGHWYPRDQVRQIITTGR